MKLFVPGALHIRGFQIAADERLFQFETQNDVHVVRRLVRLNADERRLHIVDREEEIIESDIAEGGGECAPSRREEMLPKRPAAAHLVLPEARLRFVNAQGCRRAQRRAEMLSR